MRTIEGPWGPVTVLDVPRHPCAQAGCLVMVPLSRARCHAHRRPCGKVMPVAGERCASRYGHRYGCRTRDNLDNQRRRWWYGVR